MIFDTHRDAGILQVTHQWIYLTAQYGVQGRTHIQLAKSAASTADRSGAEIGFHQHDIKCLFYTFFRSHCCQFILYGRIFRGRYVESKRQVVQPVLYDNGNVKVNHSRSSVLSFGYGSTDTVSCLEVQHGVHRVSGPIYIAAVIDGKFLDCNDRQRILHQSTAQCVTSGQCQVSLRSVFHRKIATSFQFDTIVTGVQVHFHPDWRVDMNHHQHIQST